MEKEPIRTEEEILSREVSEENPTPTQEQEMALDAQTPSVEETPTPEETPVAESPLAEEEEGGKKKRKGRYKFHLEQEEYAWLLTNMDQLNGTYKKNMRVAKIILIICFIPLLDVVLRPGNWLAMLAALVLMMVALQIKNQTKKMVKRALKSAPGGPTLLIEAGEKGLLIQEPGRQQVVLPYDHIVKVYQHGGYYGKEYLSIATGPKTSLYIPRDLEHKGYRAIERRLKEQLPNRYRIEEDSEPAQKG